MLISETSEPIAQSADPVDRVSSSPVHVRNIAFTLLSIAIVILLLQYMQPVLLPLVLGALLFYALDPAVDWLQRLRVPRAVGAASRCHSGNPLDYDELLRVVKQYVS